MLRRRKLIEVLTKRTVRTLRENFLTSKVDSVLKDMVKNYVDANEDLVEEVYTAEGILRPYERYKSDLIDDLIEGYREVYLNSDIDVYDLEEMVQSLSFEEFITVDVSSLDLPEGVPETGSEDGEEEPYTLDSEVNFEDDY